MWGFGQLFEFDGRGACGDLGGCLSLMEKVRVCGFGQLSEFD